MRYSSQAPGYSVSSHFPEGVKWLLILNIALFLVYFFAVQAGFGYAFHHFGLIPAEVLSLSVWQLFTYLFLHDPTGFGHILFNMLALWMFGADLERQWGRDAFLKYYFLCGVGAGVCVVIANLLTGSLQSRTIGASGAIYGLLMAFGLLYPDRTIWFNFLFPIKAKYFVMIIGAVTFLSSIGSSGGGVSHVAHLDGMIFGYFYLRGLKAGMGRSARIGDSLLDRYRQWKLNRAKRKFQVYLRKRESDRGPFVQ